MNLEDLYKSVPDTEYSFTLQKMEGNTTKAEYFGDFTGLIPTNRMRSAIKRKESALNVGLEAEYNKKLLGLPYSQTLDFHEKIAYLSVVFLDCPDWLKKASFGELFLGDINVINSLYEKVLNAENIFYEQIWGKDEPKEAENKS